MSPFFNGGDERVRTAGLLLARQALYQLSYTPTLCVSGAWSLPSFAFQGSFPDFVGAGTDLKPFRSAGRQLPLALLHPENRTVFFPRTF